MAILKLKIPDEELFGECSLMAITSFLQGYRLCFFLNKYLHTFFEKSKDLVKDGIAFETFKSTDEQENNWYLISHQAHSTAIDLNKKIFFNSREKIQNTYYLINKNKSIDFVLFTENKITTNFLESLCQIKSIANAYRLELNFVKKIKYLINEITL